MFAVYAPDADGMRNIIPNRDKLLGQPYCSYLVVLARSLDHAALEFLTRFSDALHVETGEAIAVLVLFDDVTVLGEYMQYGTREPNPPAGNLPTIDEPSVLDGAFSLAVSLGYSARPPAFYRASPRWSLKFADALGLNRAMLPCIVAFDDPRASADDGCVVLPLSNPDRAWSILVDSLERFAALPESQEFIRSIEALRAAHRTKKMARDKIERLSMADSRWDRAIYVVPADPGEVLSIAVQPVHPRQKAILRVASCWKRSAGDVQESANFFIGWIQDRQKAKLLRAAPGIVDYLIRNWADCDFRPGTLPGSVVRRLDMALDLLDQERSPAAIDELYLRDRAQRMEFIASLRGRVDGLTSDFAEALSILKSMQHVGVDQKELDRLEAESAAAERESRRLLQDLRFVSYAPHLSAAIRDSVVPGQTSSGTRLPDLRGRISGTVGFADALWGLIEKLSNLLR